MTRVQVLAVGTFSMAIVIKAVEYRVLFHSFNLDLSHLLLSHFSNLYMYIYIYIYIYIYMYSYIYIYGQFRKVILLLITSGFVKENRCFSWAYLPTPCNNSLDTQSWQKTKELKHMSSVTVLVFLSFNIPWYI